MRFGLVLNQGCEGKRDSKGRMVFSPYSAILIPHNECEDIISEEGQRKIFDFRKEKQMCITLGEYSLPGEETPPDILFSCLGSYQQIQEAEEFLKSLLPTVYFFNTVYDRFSRMLYVVNVFREQSNSGLKRLGVVPPLAPLAPLALAVTSNPKRNRMVRKRFGRRGKSIVVFTNNCKVELESEDCFKTPMRAIALGLRGKQSENPQVALQVLNGTLRENSAKQGNILVGQSIFSNEPEYFVYLEGGLYGWWGFYSNFRATQNGLFLNIDISSTVICSSGPVINFLCENQFVDHQHLIDWKKAERTLKNLRVKSFLTDEEFKITGLSELPCGEQLISTKDNDRDGNMDARSTEVTVHFHYLYAKNVQVSPHIPCINVGDQKKPIFLPIELCYLVPLQRWTKQLSIGQTSNLKTLRQSQCERLKELTHKVLSSKKIFGEKVPGVSIMPEFTRMGARVLSAPKLISGNGELFPQNGRWNFNNQRLVHPAKVENWAIVNFSAQQCNIEKLWTDLVRCGSQKGIEIPEPSAVIEETSEDSRGSPVDRVNTMFKKLKDTFSGPNKFLLCLLPERKNSPLYGPWKKMNLAHHGIVTQCVSPRPGKVNDRYLTNVLLKINAKLGGLNSLLSPLPLTSITMILGMNISPGQSDRPAIAAVVGSRQWPYSPLYSAAVRTQSGNVEMIDSLFKKVSDTDDEGIIRELLFDFQGSSGGRLPDQMVIFRAAVGESQFKQVLDIELAQIIEACKFIDKSWSPKFTVIVAQKNRHTRFFNKFGNIPPGTVIDTNVCHPLYNDFYLCTYDGAAVTSRPTHYHVLLDEIGFSPDDLQELVYSLSHGCQRSTTATSVVAPIRYARLAASQVAKFMKYEGSTSTSVPLVSSLHKNVSRSMFFC